jgi:hypothetical protein
MYLHMMNREMVTALVFISGKEKRGGMAVAKEWTKEAWQRRKHEARAEYT